MPNAGGDPDQKFLFCLLIIGISAFEIYGVKSLEAYEVVLGKPQFVDAISDG